MLTFGPLSFAQPLALVVFFLLPVLWWLLRLMPPAPKTVRFPPVRLLAMAARSDESPVRTPPWLTIIRLLLAAAVIIAASHPLINASTVIRGQGPLVLIIDDGWAAAAGWSGRQGVIRGLLDQAERESRAVVVVTTAPTADGGVSGVNPPRMMRPPEARELLATLTPKPWPTDRKAALEPLFDSETGPPGHIAWLSDGLEENHGQDQDWSERLQDLGTVTVFTNAPDAPLMTLLEPIAQGPALSVVALRAEAGPSLKRRLRAIDGDGRALASAALTFNQGERRAQILLELPAEQRNRLARLEIENAHTAASVVLVDERWRRRAVGLFSGEGPSAEQPLLNNLYYLERALDPYTEIRRGPVAQLLERQLSVLVLADPGPVEDDERALLEEWVKDGGVAVRFAGPRLADGHEALLPVQLRQGDRAIGGALSWNKPSPLAPFAQTSPFFGLTIPGDVRIRRQVLARPSSELASRTWARLGDGTPLVTAARRGKGLVILVHTTANAAWSNLPLSGLFEEMLRRIVALSRGVETNAGDVSLRPLQTLDAFGRLGAAPAQALAINGADFEAAKAGPGHPPGFYGEPSARRALNLSSRLPEPRGLPLGDVETLTYGAPGETDPRPGLLALALLLTVIDLAASLFLRGLLRPRPEALAALVVFVATTQMARASDEMPLAATLETRLAYVITGNQQVDETSRAGLWGLGVIVNRRTAAELGRPIGVDPQLDDLSFFPLIYWPGTAERQPLSEDAVTNLNAYLRNGGTILFDSRDHSGGHNGVLAELTADLDIPALEPISLNHVLTRAFYLLREFPGRWNGDALWVERSGEKVNDGVSPVIAGSHDWAAAWAMDEAQRPLFAVTPGGEKQREMAYRFGVNLVMYTLTGSYKADQVHLRTILKRLGE